jgi:hypothetical protein
MDWWNAPAMVLFSISSERVLLANVMDSPAVLKQEENPREPASYGSFILSFGGKLEEDEARVKQVYERCTATQRIRSKLPRILLHLGTTFLPPCW